MTAAVDTQPPGRHAADPASALFGGVHALGEAARRVSAERDAAIAAAREAQARADSETLRANAAEDRVRELEELLAHERDITATLPLPRVPAEPEPKRRGRWRR